jgi:hypothetical protein
MQATHKLAEEKYRDIRQVAYDITQEELPYQDRSAIKLTEINSLALSSCNSWSLSEHRRVHWDWEFGVRTYRRRYPNRFELAIWYNNALCGLSLGRPTYSGAKVRLDFIERTPGQNPLTGRVTPISVTAFEVYARLIDASEVRIMFPEQALIEYYSSLKYVYVKGSGTTKNPDYLYKIL